MHKLLLLFLKFLNCFKEGRTVNQRRQSSLKSGVVWIRVTNSILPMQANFRLNFFSHLHINSKIYTCQSKFLYIMHRLFYFWGNVATVERVFIKKYFATPMASPGWAAKAHEPTFTPPKSRMSLKSFIGLLTLRPSGLRIGSPSP